MYKRDSHKLCHNDEVKFIMGLLELFNKMFFFAGYFTTKTSYPTPLPPELEMKYLTLCANGDNVAREKLITHNLRLVAHIAKKYAVGNDIDDLISVGSIGLVKGIGSYQLGKGTALATYLARCIENEILMMLRSNKRYRNTVYLNEQLGVDADGNEYTLLEVLSTSEDSVFAQAESSILKQNLSEIMKKNLSKREYAILVMRYGLDGNAPLTQLETASRLNISRSYISRIETKALNKIRTKLEDHEKNTNLTTVK